MIMKMVENKFDNKFSSLWTSIEAKVVDSCGTELTSVSKPVWHSRSSLVVSSSTKSFEA